jgi:hypothetical protein
MWWLLPLLLLLLLLLTNFIQDVARGVLVELAVEHHSSCQNDQQ